MNVLAANSAPQIVTQCQQARDEIAGALSRALDRPLEVAVGSPEAFRPESLAAGGAGLAIALTVGGVAMTAILSASSGLLPAWYSAPDATGKSKLATLAQELGMLLLPETLIADDFEAAGVGSLSASLKSGGVAADAQALPLTLTSGGQRGEMLLVWPLANPKGVFAAASLPTAAPTPMPAGPAAAKQAPAGPRFPKRLSTYTRSLLRIQVPVTVTLAAKRQPVSQIMELGPGSILHFDKPCEEMLDLNVGEQRVAQGEAVKVGDKFGLRITSIVLPDERFKPVKSA